MSQRTPLILILLKIPVSVFLFISQFSGTLLYTPTYLYFLAIKSFVFNQKFESSSSFYAMFFVPRALLVALGFIFAIAQMLFVYNFMMDITHQEGSLMQYVTLFSTIFCLSFLFRRGYKQLFEKWKFPQLKSVIEHLEILLLFLKDMLSLVLTLVVILLIVRIRNLINYKQKSNQQNQYLLFVWKMAYYSLFEDIGLLGYLFLHIFRWRLQLTKDQMKQTKYKIQELYIVYEQVFHTLIEIVLSPLLLIMIILSKFSRRSVILMIKVFPIEMVKRIVFDHFIEFLQETIRFFLFCVGCLILPYKIKLIPHIFSLYDEIFKQIKDQLNGKEYQNHSLENYLKLQQEAKDNLKQPAIKMQNYFILTHLFDIIAIICLLLQAVTIFYLKRLNLVLKKEQLSYNYFQKFTKEYDDQINSIRKERKLSYSNLNLRVQGIIIVGFLKMLFDIPFYIIGLLSIIVAPWRAIDFRSSEYKKMKYMDRRVFAVKSLVNSVIDWFVIILFAVAFIFTSLFRWSYIKKTISAILKNDKANAIIPDSNFENYNNDFIFNNLQLFMIDYFISALFDIFYSPLFLISFSPIYTIKIYTQIYSSNDIKQHELTKSRRVIFTVLKYLLIDLSFILLFAIINITYYKRSYYYSQLQKVEESALNQYLKQQRIENQNNKKNKSNQDQQLKNKKDKQDKESSEQQDSDKNESQSQIKDMKVKNKLQQQVKEKDPVKQNNDEVQAIGQSQISEIQKKYFIRTLKLGFLILIFYFIILDIISLISRSFILLTYVKEKKYRLVLSQKLEELQKKEKCDFVDIIIDYEHFKFKLKFKISIKLAIQIIVAFLCICFSVVSTWRIPFLIMIIRSKFFIKQLIGKEKLKTPIHFSIVYGITFVAYILDLIYFPLILVSSLMNPLVVVNYIKNITYRYREKINESLMSQVYTHKRIIFHYVFVSALRDITMMFKLICVLLTGIRVPFLILMSRKNLLNISSIYTEFYSMVKPQSNKISSQESEAKKSKIGQAINKLSNKINEEKDENKQNQQQVDSLTEFIKERQYMSKKLTFRKCVNVSFVEMLQDIPLVIFSILIVIVFPWRLFSIIRLWKQTLLKIPQIEDQYGRVKLQSVRTDLIRLFGNVFSYDLPCIILNCILILSIYKIPKVIHLLTFQLRKTFRKKNTYAYDILENFDYRKELKKQVKQVWQDVQTWSQYLIIHLLFIRIKNLRRRLNRFDNKKQTLEKLRLYSLLNPIPVEDRPTRACMQTLSFNVYSRIADFLDVKDLGSMLLTNRKLHIFTKQEIIWQHLFENKFSQFNIHFYQDTFKLKCIEGYIYEQKQQIGKPISEEIRDDIIGRNHIIFDEYLLSLFEFPSFLAEGFSQKVSKLLLALPQNQASYNQLKQNYNKSYYISFLSKNVDSIVTEMVQFEVNEQGLLQKEKSVVFIQRFIYTFLNFFENYVYYLSLFPQKILKILNAGDPKIYHLDHIPRQNLIMPQEAQPYPTFKSLVYCFFQTFGQIAILTFFQTLFLGCFEYKYFYLGGSFLESIFWPNPLFLLIQLVASIYLIIHQRVFLLRVYLYFRPIAFYIYLFKKIAKFVKYVLTKLKNMLKAATIGTHYKYSKLFFKECLNLIQFFLLAETDDKIQQKWILLTPNKCFLLLQQIQSIRRSYIYYFCLCLDVLATCNRLPLQANIVMDICSIDQSCVNGERVFIDQKNFSQVRYIIFFIQFNQLNSMNIYLNSFKSIFFNYLTFCLTFI
ncbi:F-box protein (macronuclear) [Tetrahymena thermophila SB210]|uniref:F-box protein n=1 Tax=Tetrahymena thermophila (strain SB210) TaxID=312017 RepID=W7XJ56_TETTS|nr:F-box protein [Tetrahymena thermophila SB210]EWS73869.1 F-box protein [Tetrahymena thermophila SB210]|eukprot:XP_012653616.1 F-box protein [Tetrahymena thermophila SB210]